MLVEFRVKNFRSFREEAVLKLVASNDKTNEETSVKATGNLAVPRLLCAAAIYGANGGGKSNFIRAIQIFRRFLSNTSSFQFEISFHIQSFILNSDTVNQPVEFEITFLLDNVRYQYGFTLTPKKIISEWLIVYKSARPTTWFERNFNPEKGKYDYKFSNHLPGAKTVWRDATREDALYLTTAVSLNSENLRPLLEFMITSLVVLDNTVTSDFSETMSLITENNSKNVLELLSAADISISDIIKIQKIVVADGKLTIKKTFLFDQIPEEAEVSYIPRFEHKTATVSKNFEFEDESEGTQRFFTLLGPIIQAIKNGKVLIIDELDRSLHPMLVRQIILMFQNPKLNRNGAQLIFTTHDTSLLDGNLMRRDQIWFAEKDEAQASQLIPLSDFSPRKGEALERGYLLGRYGGVPILRSLRFK